jgi:cytochrome c oxidase subunit 4
MAEHIVPPRTYALVLVALLVLTALTVGISRLDMPPAWHLVIGLTIAVVKASLVLLFFMHVYYSSRLIWLIALGGLLWLAILIFLTMNDYLTRSWYPPTNF